MKRDMTGLEAAEVRFVRSVTGYTSLDKIRREIVRKELEIPGIQDVRTKHKSGQNKERKSKERTRDPWNTRSKNQTQVWTK